ncbi:MAG: HEAT repeat domain-containing protein [Planctomycetota bacterium]|jgi:HEAT repeat protein
MARRRTVSQEEITASARRALDQVKAAEDIDAAAAHVLAEAPDLRARQAVVELSLAESDRVTGALVGAALHSGDAALARAASDLLLDLQGSPAALEVLKQCLRFEDPLVRMRGVEALEGYSDPAVISLVPDALRDESDSVRRAAVSAIILIIGIPHHPLRAAFLYELSNPQSQLVRAILENEDTQVRRQAAQGLGFVNSDLVLPTLDVFRADEDAEVRQEIVLCLAAIATEPAAEMMAQMLDDPNAKVASTALDMLAALLGATSQGLLQHLSGAMLHPAVEVRRHAVLMLTGFDAEQAMPILEKATGDSDFEVARRAGEMLRKVRGDAGLGWLADEMASQAAGQRALTVWEAGNIGLGAGGAAHAEELIPMLERTLREGSASDKVHAVNELSSLRDVADSAAMQDALTDPDPGVRSRAADTLQYTRDAGLLVRVGQMHPDPMVRRRATEALVRNPGGLKGSGGMRRDVAFTSTRTLGADLFGYFLRALRDPDEGVRRHACAAICEYAKVTGLLPVRLSVRALEALADEETVSYLQQEDAAGAAQDVRKAPAGDLFVEHIEGILEWRGLLAREAHAIRWDASTGCYAVDSAVGSEAAARWAEAYKLSPEQSASLLRAAGGQGLDEATGRRVLAGLTRELSAALKCVAHGAGALRWIQQAGSAEVLERWTAAVQAGPKLEWGPQTGVARLQRRLNRARRRAWVVACLGREMLSEEPSVDTLGEASEDADDWVRLVALCAVAELSLEPEPVLERVRSICREHLGETGYREPIGLSSVALLRGDVEGALEMAEYAMTGRSLAQRMQLTRQVLLAAQEDRAGAALEDYLVGKSLDTVPALCLALALRGAGRSIEGLRVPAETGESEWSEKLCACLALRAMANEPDAAAKLEDVLRHGEPRQRYCSAYYLSLARVRTALPILASVLDRGDAPYMLRGLCAASLIRGGHPAGLTAMQKLVQSASGRVRADLLTHLCRAVEDTCRAVEDTIPLMLKCSDVNSGRFV